MEIKRRDFLIGAAASMTVLVAGCNSGTEQKTEQKATATPSGQKQDTTPVRIGVAAPSATLLLPFVAKDKGLFEKQGITSPSVTFIPGPQLVPSLAGGAVDFAIVAAPAADLIAISSDRVKVLASWMRSSGQFFVAAPDIKKLEDLKGRKVAINGSKGGSSSMLMNAALRKVNLTFDDVQVSVLQDAAAQVSAYASGQVDAMVTFPPNIEKVQKARPGTSVIDEMRDVFLPSGQVVVNAAWAESHPEATVGVLKALQAALSAWRTDQSLGKSTIAAQLKLDPTSPTVESLYAHSMRSFEESLYTMDLALEERVMEVIRLNGFAEATAAAAAKAIAPQYGEQAFGKR